MREIFGVWTKVVTALRGQVWDVSGAFEQQNGEVLRSQLKIKADKERGLKTNLH